MEWMFANIGSLLEVAAQVIAVAAVIATFTKTQSDNKIIGVILKFINVLAMNFAQAKNADDV